MAGLKTHTSSFNFIPTTGISCEHGSHLHALYSTTSHVSIPHRTLNFVNGILPQELNISSIGYLLSGASARIGGAILTAPLDTIKARRQFTRKATTEIKHYATTRELVTSMFKNEGILSFYRGLPARLLYVGPAAAISFLFYEQFRFMVHRPKVEGKTSGDYVKIVLPLVAAGVLRVIGTCLRTPFDVVRQRMQIMGGLAVYDAAKKSGGTSKKGIHKNTFQAITNIIRTEGFGALFSGVGVTICRDIPFSIAYFLAYETFRSIQQNFHGGSETNDKLGAGNHMLAGALAAATGVVVSNPLDLIKTRLQTQGSLDTKYTGIRHCFMSILKEEGPKAFYKGLGPRLLYLCPSAALTFALYEQFKKFYAGVLHIDKDSIQKPPKSEL